jgi:hypothetical protein
MGTTRSGESDIQSDGLSILPLDVTRANDARDGKQAGDPALAAKAIIAVTCGGNPPWGLILGADGNSRRFAKIQRHGRLRALTLLLLPDRKLYLLPHGRVAAWRSRNRNRDVWIVNGNAEPHLRV